MHPTQRILALKAGRQLQIFSIEAKTKVKSHVMNEDVVYWTWISDSTLGLVTAHAVYHWPMDVEGDPSKVFDRHASLVGSQIINYRTTSDADWMVLIGISGNTAPNGFKIKGNIQLYNKRLNVSQPIEGHAAAFAELKTEDASTPYKLFTFSVRTATGARLHIVEIDHQQGQPAFAKKAVDVFFPPEAANDFPVAMQISKRFGIIYLITKYGFVHLYDLETGTCIYMNRISGEAVFTSAPYESMSGIVAINRKGQVLSVAADENTLVPYTLNTLNNTQLAFKLASRGNLPGADDLYLQQFQNLFASGQFGEAAKIAANSPRGILRTPETIEKFKQVPAQPGTLSPILQYFGILLERGSLNRYESLELARPVLQQGRKHLLEKWLKEDKIECSEELGDVVRPHDMSLALSIYLRANVPNKVVASMAELGQVDKIVLYARKVGYTPDYATLLQHIVRRDPEKGAEFASTLVQDESGPLVDVERVTDIFMGQNMIQQATSFLLDALKDNKAEQGHLQTRLLEMNLVNAPQVADAILGNSMFTHYDRPRIANLAEKSGLLQRALEHYDDIRDIKRVVVHTNQINTEWLVEYFGRLTVEQSFECMREMLKVNIRQNLAVVVQIATKYSDLLGPVKLIEMFESFKSFEGLYYFLGSVVNLSTDPEVHFKYIQAATRTGQIREVERICRESNYYNPEKVKNFLKEAKLQDQLPLIIVCDRFNFVHDLVLYLYQKMMPQFIETYVQRVNSERTPEVVGALLDVDCDEGVIKNLLASVTGHFSIEDLVAEVEKRNRLKLILPWIQARVAAEDTDQALYNALAKIYIDTNNNPEQFLKENTLYDPKTIGAYSEKRDPYLAYIAYAKGFCDDDLIRVTNENGMFKHQARYLVLRRDLALWDQVLSSENVHRRQLIDQVVATAVPESTNPEDVSVTVKAFMAADLPHELIELLEKIILEPSAFSENRSLQNLLLLTAVRTDKGKVMGLIERLQGYDEDEIAKITIDNGLYEEALKIYQKAERPLDAMNVLVEHIVSIDRAALFANKLDHPELWSRLAKAQLDGLRVKDAIDSYIRAEDPSNFSEVIEIAERAGREEELIRYLQMARKKAREPLIDTEYAYCLAKANRLSDMEEFLSMTNVADLLAVGEKCFNDELYEAAKMLFTSVSNYARLATTLVFLGDYQGAVEAARKAGNTAVWKQVHAACLKKGEYKLAQIAGLAVVGHAEELGALTRAYERLGLFDELLDLLQAGLGLESASKALFTLCAQSLAKYQPTKLMEHLKLHWSRINLPPVARMCEQYALYPEAAFCLTKDSENDEAAMMAMDRVVVWDDLTHDGFKDLITRVSNVEIFYRAINFYVQQHPLRLNDLLVALSATKRLDHGRVVRMLKKADQFPLASGFLLSGLKLDIPEVNEAVFDLLIEEEDHAQLRSLLGTVESFGMLELARRLENSELLEFRRIAVYLYNRLKLWDESIALSQRDRLLKDAIATASESNSVKVAKALFEYIVSLGNWEATAAMLYACEWLLEEDYVQELRWRKGIPTDFVQPYVIQQTATRNAAIKDLAQQLADLKTKAVQKEEEEDNTPILGPGAMGPRLITAAPTGLGPQATGMGIPPQGTGLFGGMF